NATDHIGRPARRKWNDHADWPRRIGLRPCDARGGRECGSTRCQMQKLSSVGKFHEVLPVRREPRNLPVAQLAFFRSIFGCRRPPALTPPLKSVTYGTSRRRLSDKPT